MRVAALYDLHGNLPALDAVLAEVASEQVDTVVVGGDVAAGPMPRETLERLLGLHVPAQYVCGNADREVVDAFDQGRIDWALETGAAERWAAFAAARLEPRHRDFLAGFRARVSLRVPGLGSVLFCHGSPRSDTEIVTPLTPDSALEEMLDGVQETVVVLGHTHRQFDRRLGGRRVVNAGSVGLPYEGHAGAYWALLDQDVELRRTMYDVGAATAVLLETGFPDAEEMTRESLTEPIDAEEASAFFEELARPSRS